jgi:hypothetical protein
MISPIHRYANANDTTLYKLETKTQLNQRLQLIAMQQFQTDAATRPTTVQVD